MSVFSFPEEKYFSLNKLDIHKSKGPDGLLPQELASVIVQPLSIIFEKLRQSVEVLEDSKEGQEGPSGKLQAS